MTSFRFTVRNEGTPDQVLWFKPDQGVEVTIPIPNEILPSGAEARFRREYALLVQAGLIEDQNPIWDDSTQPPNNET